MCHIIKKNNKKQTNDSWLFSYWDLKTDMILNSEQSDEFDYSWLYNDGKNRHWSKGSFAPRQLHGVASVEVEVSRGLISNTGLLGKQTSQADGESGLIKCLTHTTRWKVFIGVELNIIVSDWLGLQPALG